MITRAFRFHPIMAVHAVLVGLLLPGLLHTTGFRSVHLLALYLLTAVGSYAVLTAWKVPFNIDGTRTRGLPLRWLAIGTFVITIFVTLVHWSSLGHVPLIEALRQTDDVRVSALRHAATDVPVWIVYAEHFIIKGLVPVTLVLLWPVDRRWFWAIALTGSCYAISLIQKSHIITLFVPLWMAFLLARRWIPFAVLTAGFALVLGFLVVVGKPEKLKQVGSAAQEGAAVVDEGVARYGLVGDIVRSIAKRVFITPGWTVAVWFEHVPTDIPFQQGAAVRPLGAVVGRPYRDLAGEIYALEYPRYAAQGVQGTVGSAAFMYDYANFGIAGLVIAGLLTGALLWMVTLLFRDRWRWAIALNTYPLLTMCATALPTVALSHGWALTLVLFAVFNDRNEPLP